MFKYEWIIPTVVLIETFTARTGVAVKTGPVATKGGTGLANGAVPGILIDDNKSGVCAEVALGDINNFHLCFFLKISNESSNLESKSTIVELRDSDNTFEITYDGPGGLFLLTYKGITHEFPKLLEVNDWIKLCILTRYGEIDFEVNSRSSRKRSEYKATANEKSANSTVAEEEESSKVTNSLKSWISVTSASSLCVGSYDPTKSTVLGSIAGITIKKEGVPSNGNDTCLASTKTGPFYRIGIPTNKRGAVIYEPYDLREICWKINVYVLFEDPIGHVEHSVRCNILKGRLVKSEDIFDFSDKLKAILTSKRNYELQNPVLFNTHSWLFSDTEKNPDICTAYDFKDMTFSLQPCKTELKFNLCMIPKYVDYYYYGSLTNYDRNYLLLSKNHSLLLQGEYGSFLEKKEDHWILYSNLHENYLELRNRSIPAGRNKWKDSDGLNEHLLTIANCGIHEFACTDGHCVSSWSRCNEFQDCQDNSDEVECATISKKLGYRIDISPPQRHNESGLTIEYWTLINSISSISALDGMAIFNVRFIFHWYDVRINYNAYSTVSKLDCKDIWIPSLNIKDASKTKLKYEINSQKCSRAILSRKMLLNTKIVEKNDPYMGRFVDGANLQLFLDQFITITVPCNLNLKKYPFGIEACSFGVSFDSDSGFFRYVLKVTESIITDPIKVEYYGKRILGEFSYIDSTHSVDIDRYVNVTVKLQTLYGDLVVNSFTPSFFMYLTAYGTLFFDLTDFNERVMVSMTTILILSALMTQAGNISSRTDNINYIDMWYGALMTLCFFLVIANMVIHSAEKCGKALNTFFQLLFALISLAFVAIFGLGAFNYI